jgi:hypothetical protein
VIRVACWAHVRRKFSECRTTAPVPAHEALARIRQHYRIEEACREMSADERCAWRQRAAVPALEAFGAWLDEQAGHVLPRSQIGQAIARPIGLSSGKARPGQSHVECLKGYRRRRRHGFRN